MATWASICWVVQGRTQDIYTCLKLHLQLAELRLLHPQVIEILSALPLEVPGTKFWILLCEAPDLFWWIFVNHPGTIVWNAEIPNCRIHHQGGTVDEQKIRLPSTSSCSTIQLRRWRFSNVRATHISTIGPVFSYQKLCYFYWSWRIPNIQVEYQESFEIDRLLHFEASWNVAERSGTQIYPSFTYHPCHQHQPPLAPSIHWKGAGFTCQFLQKT